MPVLRKLDAVTLRVPSIDEGLAFYRDALGHGLKWRNDAIGQAGLALSDSDTELVLATNLNYEPNWLVDSVEAATSAFIRAGGRTVVEPFDTPVGRAAVIADSFGNHLLLLDLTKGKYATDARGQVTGVTH